MQVLLIFKCGFNWLRKEKNEKGKKENMWAQTLFHDIGFMTNSKTATAVWGRKQ